MIFAPGRLLSVTEKVGSGDVVMVADLSAAKT
jgi:hypothetical protein